MSTTAARLDKTMLRVLFPLILLLVAIAVLARHIAQWTGKAPEGLYRPRRSRARRTAAEKDRTASVRISRAELVGRRDALTGADLDPDDELSRCADCQSFYGIASVRALVQENNARCVSCGSMHRVPVLVV